MRHCLLDNGDSRISHIQHGSAPSDQLVVTFSYLGSNGVEGPGFAENLLAGLGIDLICVQKRREYWYQDLSLEDFRSAVQDVIRKYNRVCFYGISMGGYAALYFSNVVRSDVLAISPRISVNPHYPAGNEARFRKSVPYTHQAMPEVARRESGRVIQIVYDQYDKIDSTYIQNEVIPAFPDANYCRMAHTGHPTTIALHEAGLIKSFALDFILHRKLHFGQSALRGKKGRSKTYLHLLGKKAAARGRHQVSAALFQKAIALDPEAPRFHRDLALSLERLGRVSEAIDAAERAMSLSPDAQYAASAAGIHLRSGNAAVAVDLMVDAVTQQPMNEWWRRTLAEALEKCGRLNEAMSVLERAMRDFPHSGGVHAHARKIAARLGRLEDALAYADRAAALDPNNKFNLQARKELLKKVSAKATLDAAG